jgi:hypothetical protein
MKLGKVNKIVQRGGGYETLTYVLGLFLVIFIGIVIYYKTIGYTISFGWDKLFFIFDNKRPISVDLTEDDKPVASVNLEPQPEPAPPILPPPIQAVLPTVSLPFSPEERPNGMPEAREKSENNSIFNSLFKGDKSVFNVSRNLYTYDDAEPLCKAMGAELASYEQVLEAYKKGADWCNYGWVKGQMAVYPTQEKTWQKLQQGPAAYRFSCGRPGVNGGFFDNPELRFGVNCVGKRPIENETDDLQNSAEFTAPPTAEQIEFDKKINKFREGLGNVSVLPFNRDQWSD